ncbi:MAG: MFS transporter [Acidobacteriota bacterium]
MRDAPVSAGAWRLLAFLTAVNVLNFVDRTLIASLAPLLIAELGLTRTQIGLLAGYGFIFFYTLIGLFLGFAADRWRRIPLVAAGLALWSGMTALSGLARSFVQLAVPRIFVGVGEATLTPAALSMLGDVFPASRLAMATGVYYTGIPLGAGASFIAASYLAPRFGWKACFFVLGAIGLVASGALLLFREPTRNDSPEAAVRADRPGFRRLIQDWIRALARNPRLVLAMLGGALLCYGAGSALHIVTWLVQERGYTFQRATLLAGVIGIGAGLLGNVAGGAFGDWNARRRQNGHLWSLIPMTLFFAPIGMVFYSLPPRTPLFYLCWFITSAGISAWYGPLFAAIQELAPAHTRATSVAFTLLVINLLGVGPGPLITGIIGDTRGLSAGLLLSVGVVALALVPFGFALRERPSS